MRKRDRRNPTIHIKGKEEREGWKDQSVFHPSVQDLWMGGNRLNPQERKRQTDLAITNATQRLEKKSGNKGKDPEGTPCVYSTEWVDLEEGLL